jgi:hypothetical protein
MKRSPFEIVEPDRSQARDGGIGLLHYIDDEPLIQNVHPEALVVPDLLALEQIRPSQSAAREAMRGAMCEAMCEAMCARSVTSLLTLTPL